MYAYDSKFYLLTHEPRQAFFWKFINYFSKNEQVGTRDISFLYEKNSDKPLLAIKHGDNDSEATLMEQKGIKLLAVSTSGFLRHLSFF